MVRMFLSISTFILLLMAASCRPSPSAAQPEETPSEESERWVLVWSDEFEGETINAENWLYDTGAGGWGNQELQYYTERPENARVEDGLLVIEAREEDYRGSDYTSARLKTQGQQSWAYGRIEARMKLPSGQGIWSAFWMLGENFPTVGWPHCGEIDIMENIGDPRTVYGTVHGPGYSGGDGIGGMYAVGGDPLSEGFHTYAIEWLPDAIHWFVDDVLFYSIEYTQVPGQWVFDHPFFLMLNLAIGGQLPGYPDETTQLPQRLLVDYVRVYRDRDLSLDDLEGGKLHTSGLRLSLLEEEEAWTGTAYVTVVDQDGNPIEGAVVTGGWLGAVTGATTQATTDSEGIAGPFYAVKVSFAEELSFCVTDIRKTLYGYDKRLNSMTCLFTSP